MKTAGIPLATLVLVLSTGGHATWAQDRPPSDFAPTPIERLDHGTRKFFSGIGNGTKKFLAETDAGTKRFFSDVGTGTKRFFTDIDLGTKRFFAGARDALGFDRPEPKVAPNDSYIPWSQDPHSARYRQYQPQVKKNKMPWLDFGSWFQPAEPEPVKTFDEWWALKRLDP